MAVRIIACILIISGITVTPLAVDGGQLLLPAPSVEQEIEHLRGARHTELMISSDTLLALEKCIEKSSGLSFTAGISWRHISHVQRLFEVGYSRVAFGSRKRALPNLEEHSTLRNLISLYGRSSFVLTCHSRALDRDAALRPDVISSFSEVSYINDQSIHSLEPVSDLGIATELTAVREAGLTVIITGSPPVELYANQYSQVNTAHHAEYKALP